MNMIVMGDESMMFRRPIEFDVKDETQSITIPFIDDWLPLTEEDKLIKWEAKDVLIMPVGALYNYEKRTLLDFFYIHKKRGYRNDKVRLHTALYLNYFEKFFDEDHELLSIYASIKWMIDTQKTYNKENLFYDIKRLIFSPNIRWKVRTLNRYNYNLNPKSYSNTNNPG